MADALRSSSRGAEVRGEKKHVTVSGSDGVNGSELVRRFWRRELNPNIERIFAGENRSLPRSRSKHGIERLRPVPLPNQTRPYSIPRVLNRPTIYILGVAVYSTPIAKMTKITEQFFNNSVIDELLLNIIHCSVIW